MLVSMFHLRFQREEEKIRRTRIHCVVLNYVCVYVCVCSDCEDKASFSYFR